MASLASAESRWKAAAPPQDINAVQLRLRPSVVCPHCWQRFSPEDVLWVASHPDLLGDDRLGPDQPLRFLPSRFNVQGNALDSQGLPCQELACPRCHLALPRVMLEVSPLFVSIAGTPSCGKSYFLAAMTWRMRQVAGSTFSVHFADADPLSNRILNHYEEQQFFNPNQDELVRLEKTEEQGDLYDTVRYGDQVVTYPRPFLFTIQPADGHPRFADRRKVARVLCLYDNAGESFQPGKDTAINPVTRHLAHSQVLLFCFDPTQDPRFRRACAGRSSDVQIASGTVTARQDIALHEIADRVRRHAGLKQDQLHQRPLVVIVTKFDAWWFLLGEERRLPDPWQDVGMQNLKGLDFAAIEAVSARLRNLLLAHTPELVAAAEGFCRRVTYIPVSATGCGPEVDPETGRIGIRPRDIHPIWCEVPLLWVLARWGEGLIPHLRAPRDGQPLPNPPDIAAVSGQPSAWPPGSKMERR